MDNVLHVMAKSFFLGERVDKTLDATILPIVFLSRFFIQKIIIYEMHLFSRSLK